MSPTSRGTGRRLQPRPVPELAKPPRAKLPSLAERTLDNGLRVVAVRRPAVPMVHLRLRIPFAGRRADHLPKQMVMTSTMTSGTDEHSRSELAIALQEVGGALSVSADADWLSLRGEALRPGLPRMLDLLAEVLTGAAYPTGEVSAEVSRLQTRLQQRRSQPAETAGEALRQRLYGDHPYGHDLPEPAEVAAVTAASVRGLHRRWVAPEGSLLVLVGDITPARVLDAVEKALGEWSGTAAAPLPRPGRFAPGGVTLIDRPGAVQSNLRLAGPAVGRADARFAALELANVVYGGYFASRLVQNIREDKGYTYSPRSSVSLVRSAAAMVVEADVATDVTGPALVEIAYELGRISTGPVTDDELASAVNYTSGLLAMQSATQAGLAGVLEILLSDGLDVTWLRDHPVALRSVTPDDVLEAARAFLAPSRLATVVVGDASRIRDDLASLDDVSAPGA